MHPRRVAIIGYAFRLPGSAGRGFWNDLLAGKNLVTEVPRDRWARDTYLHPRKSHSGSSYTFAAGTIGDIAGFDAEFFGISPREAAQMDPQQRLLLELSWEALENAGVRPSTLRGTASGVFIGVSTIDYSFRFADDLSAIDSAVATGTSSSISANRISYLFDLRGPSLAVDTACSSSLVAFHLACRSIASGECRQALTGGVSLHMHPYGFVTFSKASMLSRRGMCNVFDAAGDGYVRSEGAGVFFLKDYEQALADGDPVIAVVATSAVNSDGRKSGLTVPSMAAQAALLTQAYNEAGIDPGNIDYIEAHGTGTAVGDPIETHALGHALGRNRSRDNPLLIGSIKSNIGHLEAAAGVAGLVKALLCIENRVVPATIHLETPNPNIKFDEWNLRVARENTPLRAEGKVVIGVNSFGFGGANAHVVLESAERHVASQTSPQRNLPVPMLLAGKSAAALADGARNLAAHLRDNRDAALYDIARNLVFGRDHHEHRAMLLATGFDSAAESLDRFANGDSTGHAVEAGSVLGGTPGTAFVYAGNGAVWDGMGRRLMLEEPDFRSAIEEIDVLFQRLGGASIAAELLREHNQGNLDRTEIAQPALFAMQVGITRILRSRGLMPDAVTGHSVGEVAAAWASGALTLEQSVSVIFHRSRLQATTRGQGQMTAVGLGHAALVAMLDESHQAAAIVVAGINSSRGTTIAGQSEALSQFEAVLAQRGVWYQRLALDYAFHSPAMDAIHGDLIANLGELAPSPAAVPLYSTVTGAPIGGEVLGADYWWRNIRRPVRFAEAIAGMQRDGTRVFVEVGPHALLRGYIQHALQDESQAGRIIPTLLRDDGAPERLWAAVFQAAVAGANIDWRALFPANGTFVALPNYPWQHEPYWHAVSPGASQRLHRGPDHPLLGRRLHECDWAWESHIDTQLCPSLADHVIGDATVMPGTGFAEMALAAGGLWNESDRIEVEQIDIRAALVLSGQQTKVVRFSIDAPDGSFSIKSRDETGDGPWTLHASGRMLREPHGTLAMSSPLTMPVRTPDASGSAHDRMTAAAGLAYGPAFRAIESIWVDADAAVATFRLPREIEREVDQFHVHPALLDCTFQLIIQLLKDEYAAQSGVVYVPSKLEGLQIRVGAAPVRWGKATLHRHSPQSVVASFVLHDESGAPVVTIRQARFTRVRLNALPVDRLSYLDYHQVPMPHPLASDHAPRRLFERLHARIDAVAQQGRQRGAVKRYAAEIEPLLDGLCHRYAARALKAMATDGVVIRQADINAHVEANPESAHYVHCLIRMLLDDRSIEYRNGDLVILPYDDTPSPEDIWAGLIADYPDFLPAIHGVGRVGMHLSELLQGRRTLAETLPRDCTPGGATRAVLADVLPGIVTAVRDFVADALRRLASGKRLRILEFAAARSLFADEICGTLDFDRCDYAYVSYPDSGAEERLRLRERFPRMDLREIDAANPDAVPVSGGEHYHVALVAADFSSSAEAFAALRYVRHHLAGDAAILLIDQYPARWKDFLFGARLDWWSAARGIQPHSAQKSPSFWREHFQQAGLASSAILELSDFADAGPYLVLSQQSGAAPLTPRAVPTPRAWALLADKEGYSAHVADQVGRALVARGDRVARITPGSRMAAVGPLHYQLNPCDPEQFQQLLPILRAQLGGLDGVVHLYGLGAASRGDSPLLLMERQIDRCMSAASLTRACEMLEMPLACWIVAGHRAVDGVRGADSPVSGTRNFEGMDAALRGYARTLMNETAHATVRVMDMEEALALDTATYALVREISNPTSEREILFERGGDRFVPRLRVEPPPMPVPDTDPLEPRTVQLALTATGQLRSMRWESQKRTRPGRDQVEVDVRATGLNFRDVMLALGLLSEEMVENGFAGPSLGLEFAGVVCSVGSQVRDFAVGDRVAGFGPRSFASRVVTGAACVSPIPAGMSFAAAATIPSAFLTVHYALDQLARIAEGESLLIHGAAGGVGIAALQIAKLRGAEIFATAGSEEKRDYLRLMGADHVLDSRSLSFADDVLRLTDGRGVDIVLNSLSGEAMLRNLRVLKPFGRFLELGKRDYQENTRVGLAPFRNNISYFGIDADQLMKERPELAARLFAEVMARFAQGELHPLPHRCFQSADVVDAFRHMQQSRHIGKIVLTYDGNVCETRPAEPQKRGLELVPDATYLVTGGLRGFGLKAAAWLAAKGARHLVLLSRNGRPDPDARETLTALESQGINVRMSACDVTDRPALASLLSEMAVIMPPLRGVIHAAAVIEDGLARNVTRDQIRRVFAPKVLGAQYLHDLTLDKELDFFVLFSSATTLFGNPGQGSYVAANACVEALATARRERGLPAVCVRWGAIDDAGYLARNVEIKEALQGRMGGAAVKAAVALDALEMLLLADRSGVGVLEFDWKALARFLPGADSPTFRELTTGGEDAVMDDDSSEDIQALLRRLPADEAAAVFVALLKKEVGHILRVAPEKIDEERVLYEMGFDSLMGVELSTAIDARFAVRLPVMALSDSPTIAKLATRILAELSERDGEAPEQAGKEVASRARQIALQHADEVHVDSIVRTAEELHSGANPAPGRMIH